MGRNAGGVNNFGKATSAVPIAVNSNGKRLTKAQTNAMLSSSQGLDTLKHREVVKQLNSAISRYEKVMGVRERTVRIADTGNAYGVTYISANGSQGVYLNKQFFNQHRNTIESQYRAGNYKLASRMLPTDLYSTH